MAQIAPSILSSDFSKLGEEVLDITAKGADLVHVDVMDGMFVPNISYGAPVMKSLNRLETAPYDVHLMVDRPERYVADFMTDKTAYITVHQEACIHLDRTIHQIKELGAKAGVALNPGTPVVMLEDVLEIVDLILIMSVNPGFGGQKFIPRALDKIRRLDQMRRENGFHYLIEVDGGVNAQNAAALREAGTDILVAGSAVFKAEDRAEVMRLIKGE
ncbi:MAG: ribulose-phosphate 3-epimerase [Mogibacterium sp.]|nr:ribulose-phosphate 3-epimerase [Mogibacterium sp.]